MPDLSTTNDSIVNGTSPSSKEELSSLCLFTAQRVDYSLARLDHYTATDPKHFQNFVLFTNYQFYVDEFDQLLRFKTWEMRLFKMPRLKTPHLVTGTRIAVASEQCSLSWLSLGQIKV